MKQKASGPVIAVVVVVALIALGFYAYKTFGSVTGNAVNQANVDAGAQEIQRQDSGGPTVPPELLEKAKGMGAPAPGGGKSLPGR